MRLPCRVASRKMCISPIWICLRRKATLNPSEKPPLWVRKKTGQKYAAVIYVVKYAEGEIKYTVGYDEDMKLVQFVAQ